MYIEKRQMHPKVNFLQIFRLARIDKLHFKYNVFCLTVF